MRSTLLAMAAMLLGACDAPAECPDVGCAPELTVHFEGDPLDAPGAWTVEAALPSGTVSCSITLPADVIAGQADCDDPYASLILDEGEDELLSIRGMILEGDAPDEVEITVSRDAEVEGVATVKPTYEETRPNGPDCEPTCRNATEAVTLGL